MQASNRIIANTLAQYIRTILNMVLSLYSSRLVLDILGISDYGIYSLVAGIVSMLSFLTNSLVGSTQRFLSVSQGKGDIPKLKEVFSNSLIIHIGLGAVISVILEICGPLLFNGFLNIPTGREKIANILYQQVIWMVYISFIASPFRALLVSRENILYTSIIDVLDGILKVVLVMLLPFASSDKLLAYGWIMFGIQIFNLLSFVIYCFKKYEECILPRFKNFSIKYVKDLSRYTGWIIYSTGIIAFRTQGLAVVINRFYSASVNAAYGIGSQISGMVSFVSTAFTNAVSPQLMAAEGGGNHQRMWKLAETQSKFSFLLLAMLAIPTMCEMRTLLHLWLGQIPDYAVLFACMFIAMQTFDQLSQGLGLANKAIGNIGKYTFVTYTPKLFILPVGYIILKYFENPLIIIALLNISIEIICMLLRIYLFRRYDGFKIRNYIINVIFKTIPPVAASTLVCGISQKFLDINYRLIVTYIISVLIYAATAYLFSLTYDEKKVILNILSKISFSKYINLKSHKS